MNVEAHNIHVARRAIFERDFVPLRPILVRIAMSRVKNWYDAEDIVQNVLLRAMRRVDDGMTIRKPYTVANLMLRDGIVATFKDRDRAQTVPLDDNIDSVCLVCGSLLEALSCKMMCGRCGYHSNCSDGGAR